MHNVSLARFCFRIAGNIAAACTLLLGGCATLSAPYEYKVVDSANTLVPSKDALVLPPGATVGSKAVTFVVEHGDASPSCLWLPEISKKELPFRISSVYWRDIDKRSTRFEVLAQDGICTPQDTLRKCMRKIGTKAMAEINARPEWAACWLPTDAMEASFPYQVRESLEEDLGFAFVSESANFDVTTLKSGPSTDTDKSLVNEVIKVSVAPGQVSSVNLRPGMKICVLAEQSLTGQPVDRVRLATYEHCASFVGHDDGFLAFPGIDKLAPTIYAQLLSAHKTVAIHGVHDWSGIRSHAINALQNAFQLVVYFPREQTMDNSWTTSGHVSRIMDPETKNAGPLVLLSDTKQDMPPGRQVKLKELCGLNKFSCFLFMDRPSVRITQDIRMGQQVLEAELGMTLGELASSKSLPPVELSRPFRGRSIPVKGNADQLPLVRGDVLRRLHD